MDTTRTRETDRIREILSNAVVDGRTVRLPDQLTRDEYLQVNKILATLGGKWSRRERAHVFASDPSTGLADYVTGGNVPKHPKAAEGYVATPLDVARQVVSKYAASAELPGNPTVLEPSAGAGALVSAVRETWPAATITAVEPNRDRASLIAGADTVEVQPIETFAAGVTATFDAVVMNPPFALPGSPAAWIDHVQLVWNLVKAGGRLTAIAPAGLAFRRDRRHRAIREFVEEHGGWADLRPDAFVASGTAVRTVVLWADKVGG